MKHTKVKIKILNVWKSDEQIKEYYEEGDCVFEYGDYRIFKQLEESYLHTYKNIAFNCLVGANEEHLINVANRNKPNIYQPGHWLYDGAIETIEKGIKLLK